MAKPSTLCPKCKSRPKKPRKPGGKVKFYSYCAECQLEYNRTQQGYSGRRERLRQAGICNSCEERPRREGKTTCRECDQLKGYKDHIRKTYGLSYETYLEMLSGQDGLCAICESPRPSFDHLSVDHDHNSGKVRGLLCTLCNQGLGDFKDSPALLRKALGYLEAAA